MLNKLLKNSRYDKITHRTPEYFKTMEIYQENIDKDDNKTWRTIYKVMDEPYFKRVNMS